MKHSILALALAVLTITPAHSASIRYDKSLPMENAFLSNPNIGSGGSVIGYTSTANRWAGFTFSPDTNVELGQISFYISSNSSALANKEISIQIVTVNSLTDSPDFSNPSTIITTERGTLPESGLTLNTFSYVTISLDTGVSLQAGSFYGVVVKFLQEPDNNTSGFSIRNATTSSSMQGGIGRSFFTDNAGETYTSSNASFVFSLAATSIPEPSTAAVLGSILPVALCGYLIKRRRHN